MAYSVRCRWPASGIDASLAMGMGCGGLARVATLVAATAGAGEARRVLPHLLWQRRGRVGVRIWPSGAPRIPAACTRECLDCRK